MLRVCTLPWLFPIYHVLGVYLAYGWPYRSDIVCIVDGPHLDYFYAWQRFDFDIEDRRAGRAAVVFDRLSTISSPSPFLGAAACDLEAVIVGNRQIVGSWTAAQLAAG